MLTFVHFFVAVKAYLRGVMTNEFRTLNLECSNLVPQGPDYEIITLEYQEFAPSLVLLLVNGL